MSTRKKLKRRLSKYWQLEAFNAVAIIPLAFLMLFVYDSKPGWLGVVCMIPTVLLLVVGAAYWRGKYRRLLGEHRPLDSALRFADQMEIPLRWMCLASILLCVVGWLVDGVAASMGDLWVATFAAVCAVLEQVNYYHRQLQHFDHWPDFKRLLTGEGFRAAQMAIDLRQWRQAKS